MAGKDAGNGLFTLVDYARSLIETMMEAHDRFYVKESDFDRTIAIDSLGVGTTDFELPRERAVAHLRVRTRRRGRVLHELVAW